MRLYVSVNDIMLVQVSDWAQNLSDYLAFLVFWQFDFLFVE